LGKNKKAKDRLYTQGMHKGCGEEINWTIWRFGDVMMSACPDFSGSKAVGYEKKE
jgi:hypothetical protein